MSIVAITANTSWYLYNFRKNTIIDLIKNGYIVLAIAPEDEYSQRIRALGAEFVNVYIDQGGKNPFHDLRTVLDFMKIFNKYNIDVVLNFTPKNNIYSTFSAMFFRIPVINNIAGLGGVFVNGGLVALITKLLYRISQRHASKVFFQNNDDLDYFVKNKLINKSIAERIPGSGVDLTRFGVAHAANDNVVRFILIARMLYEKGIVYYVEAARVLKKKYGDDVQFYLLGFLDANNPTAITKFDMEQWVSEGIVTYLGVSDAVESEMSNMDCVVLPSFYREGVPKSLLEAGAMGKPIITTNNVGCRDVVDDGYNGFICEPRSTVSLISAMENIISMGHENRICMGLNSRAKIEKEFNEEIIINKYIDTLYAYIQK